MILNSLLFVPLAFSPAAPTAAPSVAPRAALRSDELEELVQAQLSAIEGQDVPEIWRRAAGLREIARGEAAAQLDATLDRSLSGASALTSRAAIFLCVARLQGEDVEPTGLLEALSPVLASSEDELRTAAAGLLADSSFRRVDAELKDELVADLLEGSRGDLGTTEFRLACASAAYALGGGAAKRDARQEMMAYLTSADPALRSAGALALASTGEEIAGLLEQELVTIASLPDEAGALARAYLKQEDIRRLHDRRFRNLERLYEDRLPSEELSRISAVMRMVREDHLDGAKFTDQELMNGALDGMLRMLDRHSSYMPADAYARFYQELEAEYGGIGAYVGEDPSDGLFTITKPIYSGPAYRAGLGTDDKIVRIDDWSTLGQPVDEIIKRLKGQPGTSVELYVWHRGMDPGLIDRPTEEMRVSVRREQIAIPAVKAQMLPGGVGLVELVGFSRVASQILSSEIQNLLDQGAQGLVLDLRYNSGGLLDQAVEVSDIFLPRGKLVVTTDSRMARPEHYYTREEARVPEDMPVVVLVNRFTASASEIVAGALADHERAIVLGERTYGKGAVQTLIPVVGMRDDDYLDENRNRRWDNWEPITRDWDRDGEMDFAPRVKMTIARWLLPSGRSIHREFDVDKNILQEGGIEPTEEVRAARVEAWRLEEQRRIVSDRTCRNWVDDNWEGNEVLFAELAETDGKDVSLYPGFQAFYDSLATVLPEDDVRFLVRREVRRRVQDGRGAEFPFGDYQEDVVLQEAIRSLYADLGLEIETVGEFAATFDEDAEEESEGPRIASLGPRLELQLALDLAREAQTDAGSLDATQLQELIELLDELDG